MASFSPLAYRNGMYERTGFTLVEILAVLSILGLLAAAALGVYGNYTAKGAYSEVMIAAKVYKRAVEVCALTNTMESCNSGENGVPESASQQAILSVSVMAGEITITPQNYKGVTSSDIYVLVPTGGGSGAAILSWTDNCASHRLC